MACLCLLSLRHACDASLRGSPSEHAITAPHVYAFDISRSATLANAGRFCAQVENMVRQSVVRSADRERPKDIP